MKKVIAMNGREEQMDDLIKRQDAITAYCEHECGIKGMTRENCGATDCGTIFDDIPAADFVEGDKAQKEIDYWHDKAQSYEQTILKLSLNKADVVEVVRCKDCKHNYMKSWNQGKRDNPICHFTDYRRSNEFYCGFGERTDA